MLDKLFGISDIILDEGCNCIMKDCFINAEEVEKFEVVRDPLDSLVPYWKDVFNALDKKNAGQVLEIWRDWLKDEVLSLPHPLRKGVVTYARCSYMLESGWSNTIYFSDANGNYPWILEQSYSVCDSLVVEGKILLISKEKKYLNLFNRIQVIDSVKGCLRKCDDLVENAPIALLLNHARPFHFLYEQFSNILHISELAGFKISISEIKPFCTVSSLGLDPSPYKESVIYLLPLVFIGYRVKEGRMHAKIMEEKVKEFSLLQEQDSLDISLNPKKVFRLWFGITGQKRAWVEQVECCILLIKNLSSIFDQVELVVDGFTAPFGEVLEVKEDNEVYEKIKEGTREFKNVNVKSVIGKDYSKKIQSASRCDFFIANSGSGSITPLLFSECPGVVHGLIDTFRTERREKSDKVIFVGSACKPLFSDRNKKNIAAVSYHLSPSIVLNLVLGKIGFSGRNDYSLLDFSLIESKLIDKYEAPDLLRDLALLFADNNDLFVAERLMSQAHLLRPHGPVISRKLEEFRSKLAAKKQGDVHDTE